LAVSLHDELKNTIFFVQTKIRPKNNRPTFLLFFFLGAPCVGCGPSADMPPHVGTRSWLWGLPFELVPSDDPFMWFLDETFFFADIFLFFSNGHFFPFRARN
jgi:hypothetical protein